MARSFFETIPCPAAAWTAREPLPFKVRSSFENIAASILFSSIAIKESPPESVFCVPFARVRKTLSALLT